MSSITEPIARALAYRWGELQEEPPAFIDALMIDLTEALVEAEAAGDEVRAECLDEVLDALAEGIAKHERRADPDFGDEALGQAIAELRTYYLLESGLPSAERQKAGRSAVEQRVPRPLPGRTSRKESAATR